MTDPQPENLESVLQKLDGAADGEDRVSIGSMLEATGQRSFGVLLLVPGLLVLSPLLGIPGLPTFFAVMIVLVATQLLIGRHHFWIPRWLLQRSASRRKYDKAMGFLHRLAKHVDRILRPRLEILTTGIAVRLTAVLCVLVAITMPPLELIPFANSLAGVILTLLGLGMMARDGAMILAALGLYGVLLFLFIQVLF